MYNYHCPAKCQKHPVVCVHLELCVCVCMCVCTHVQADLCVCSCWEEDKVFPVELACRLYIEGGERETGNGFEIGVVLGAREVLRGFVLLSRHCGRNVCAEYSWSRCVNGEKLPCTKEAFCVVDIAVRTDRGEVTDGCNQRKGSYNKPHWCVCVCVCVWLGNQNFKSWLRWEK